MIHERKYIPAVLVLVLFAGGCSLELRDFSREMFLETLPARRNQVLSAEAVPSVLFRADILRSSAEKALSVGSARGTLPGSRRWEGNRLSFFPDEPLTAGTVYFLNIIGTLTDREGRIYPVKQSIPFFSGSETGEILKISEISPPSGSTLSNSMTHLEVRFSLPVLRASMEKALYLVPK